MTLLQIDKRAASAADGQALIDRSLSMSDPFGVPTLHFSSQDMNRVYELGVNGVLSIEKEIINPKLDKLMEFLEQQGRSPLERREIYTSLLRDFVMKVRNEITGQRMPYNMSARLSSKDFQQTAENYGAGRFISPIGNMVFRSGERTEMTFFDYEDVQRLNGADRYHDVWHENAHGLGAGEPQADLIGAIITRQSFEPSNVIKMWADQRALDEILNYDKKDRSTSYGWGCVDVNDFIAAQPEEKILGLSEAKIKALRFNRFDPLTETVEKVGKAIRNSGVVIQKRENLHDLGMYAAGLANGDLKDDEVAQYVSKRFALACTRALYGDKMYKTAPDLSPPFDVYPSFIDEPEI